MNDLIRYITRYVAALCAILTAFSPSVAAYAQDAAHVPQESCASLMGWPVRAFNPQEDILQHYDAPAQPWLPGHRGVDMKAPPGTELIAPASGVVSFTGKVADKDVVVITHAQGWRSTFEPAVATVARGMKVKRGEVFAVRSEGISDHCTDQCVQWGVKVPKSLQNAKRATYLDPEKLTRLTRIILKRPR